MEGVRDRFLKGVFGFPGTVMDDGGEACFNEMSTEYRFAVGISSVFLHFLIFKFSSQRYVQKKHVKMSPPERLQPSFIEMFFGVLVLLSLFAQATYKFLTNRLINMFNPCHVVTLMEGYLLVSNWTIQTERVFLALLSWHFGSIVAVFVPTPGLITLPGEIQAFWLQHYLIAFVCPIVLHLSGRYSRSYHMDIRASHYGWFTFVVYQRLFLTCLSLLTWANLNFTLCGASTDPFVEKYGNYYYIMAELYLGFAGIFCGRFVAILCKAFQRIFEKNKIKEE